MIARLHRLRLELPATPGLGRRVSFLTTAVMRMVRGWSARITVRVEEAGFAAAFRAPHAKSTWQATWHAASGTWQPEDAWKRLVRAATVTPVDLTLPRELVLSQQVRLPKVALANLSEAISYGLPAWSPFQAGDVYVSARVEELHGTQALVRVHYVLKAKADPLIARLAAVGLSVDRLILQAELDTSVALPTPKLSRLKRARRIDGALAITAIILAMVLGSVQVMMTSRRIDEVQVMLRAELAGVRQEEALQAAYASYLARRAAVADRQAADVGAYELLSALARHLPEGALIQALEIGGSRGRLELSGTDPEAILNRLKLIPLIHHPKTEARHTSRTVLATFELAEKRP